ncbi:MAG: hypothetical protein M3461_12415 [Pseudomonadota bacterium]|nr:hypothetical protein [Pseudomonadota bacterium]
MRITVALGLTWATMAGGVVSAQAPLPKGAAEGAMSLHHLHMSMLDHGLGMAAEGSNLLMLSEMGRCYSPNRKGVVQVSWLSTGTPTTESAAGPMHERQIGGRVPSPYCLVNR